MPVEHPKPVGRILSALMAEKSLTDEALAGELGVNRRTVYRWRRGENEPQPMMAMKLGARFGIEWTEFYS